MSLPDVEILLTLDESDAEELYALYSAAFEPLRTLAAARQVFHRDEFMEEMHDERIQKHVVHLDGHAVGLTTLTNDISALPWIEPAYYAARFPAQTARNAVFYLGSMLAHPDYHGSKVFPALMFSLVKVVGAVKGICAMDMCLYNETERALHKKALAGTLSMFPATLTQLDVQSYYALDLDPS